MASMKPIVIPCPECGRDLPEVQIIANLHRFPKDEPRIVLVDISPAITEEWKRAAVEGHPECFYAEAVL